MTRYKVHVLYFINPFLMWVEVLDKRTRDKVFFEQIGIFGLIPKSGNPFNEPYKSRRVSVEYDYSPVDKVVQPHLDNAEIWFTPRLEMRGYSLFNKNIHKFGYLRAVYPNGRSVDLRYELLVNDLATYNEKLFMKCIKAGVFKPKLKIKLALNTCFLLDAACKDKDIEPLWLRCLRSQTSRVRSRVSTFGGRFYKLMQPIPDNVNVPQEEEHQEAAVTNDVPEQEPA